MKKTNIVAGLLVAVTQISSIAYSAAYPRPGNRATEVLCSDPDLYQSMAVGALCSGYYSSGNWHGHSPYNRTSQSGNYSNSDANDGFSSESQFDRLENR